MQPLYRCAEFINGTGFIFAVSLNGSPSALQLCLYFHHCALSDHIVPAVLWVTLMFLLNFNSRHTTARLQQSRVIFVCEGGCFIVEVFKRDFAHFDWNNTTHTPPLIMSGDHSGGSYGWVRHLVPIFKKFISFEAKTYFTYCRHGAP